MCVLFHSPLALSNSIIRRKKTVLIQHSELWAYISWRIHIRKYVYEHMNFNYAILCIFLYMTHLVKHIFPIQTLKQTWRFSVKLWTATIQAFDVQGSRYCYTCKYNSLHTNSLLKRCLYLQITVINVNHTIYLLSKYLLLL